VSARARGFVLATVLFALVVLSALASAGFFAALQALRAGRNARDQVRARAAADGVLAQAIGTWDPRTLNALAVGDSLAIPAPPLAGVTATADVVRLSSRLFLVRSQARAGEAAQAQWAVTSLRPLEPTRAAVRARAVDPSLLAAIDSTDRPPAGWACSAPGLAVPATQQLPGASDSALFALGPWTWASVAAWAAALPPGGDSLEVHYAPGNLIISGGKLIGTFVVEGDLTLRAGAVLVGLVLVHDTLRLEGAGGAVFGQVIASQVVAFNGYAPVPPVVQFSSCAVDLAVGSRAPSLGVPGLPHIASFR